MTYVKSYITENIAGKNRVYKKEVIILECDSCGEKYNCNDRYKIRAKKSSLHFCSRTCSSKSFTDGKLRKKLFDAIIEKYDGYYVETNKFKKEQKQICMDLYGVSSRLESMEIREKIKITNIKKFGQATFAGSSQHVKSLNYKEIAKKAWETKIKNGSCSKSKPEEQMYTYLIDMYGVKNVKRQKQLLNQFVDFYITTTNTYIQVDGVYWHGLNRPTNKIKMGKTLQDKKIYKQILRDKDLNEFCRTNNINLIRFTDDEIKSKTKEEIYASISSFM